MAAQHGSRKSNCLRIIGGEWRGRRLSFPDSEGLRPTPDRVRETLFNWLQPVICGARCLDLFAGSGALGFEALSRGASEVVMVERDALAISSLREQLEKLKPEAATHLVHVDAIQYLERAAGSSSLGKSPLRHPLLKGGTEEFDVVFIDPPFGQNLLRPCIERLEAYGWLKPVAYIYLEAEETLATLALPRNWHLTRSKRASHVGYHLARRTCVSTIPDNTKKMQA